MPQNKFITKGLDEIYEGKIDTRTVDEVVDDIAKEAGLVINE